MRYRNPIIPGFYPDPSICRVGDDYYLVTSTFEFFPGVPVFHSRDLVNWTQIGHCLTRKSQLDLDGIAASKGIYAPTIRYHDGKFYMITTNTTKCGNFYVWTEDPSGEWSEPIFLPQVKGIDPSLFFDDDGTAYVMSNARGKDGNQEGMLMAPINLDTGELLDHLRPVWGGTGGKAPESPHLYKINGWYYQMIAEGGTELGHMSTVARSKNIWGPYESCPYNPILTHFDQKRALIQATGHADFIEDPDGCWWAVFLAYRQTHQYFHHLGRETFLAPVTWTEDGWPLINNKQPIQEEMDTKGGRAVSQEPRTSIHTKFDEGKPGLAWVYLRNPHEENYDFSSGCLRLKGSPLTLSDIASPTFFAVRQGYLNGKASVCLSFDPQQGEEAGISVFYKYDAHYDIALTCINGQRCIIVRKVVGDISHIAAQQPIANDRVTIQITADKLAYHFSALDGDKEIPLGSALTRYVSTEAHELGFTGVFYALYATGNGHPCSGWAVFHSFDSEEDPQ